ncbi:hypothetical protein V8F06_012083 [Rhypophila decipiens]
MHFGHWETEASQKYKKTGCVNGAPGIFAWLVTCLAVILDLGLPDGRRQEFRGEDWSLLGDPSPSSRRRVKDGLWPELRRRVMWEVAKEPSDRAWMLKGEVSAPQRLDNPVFFDGLEDIAGKRQHPKDMQKLYYNIYATIKYQNGIYPHEIRAPVEAVYDGYWHLHAVCRKLERADDEDGMGHKTR